MRNDAAIGIIVVFALLSGACNTEIRPASLTFSSTQSWDEDLFKQATTIRGKSQSIQLPPPPLNDSKIVQAELRILKSYVILRTDEKLSQIVREIELHSTEFNGTEFATLLGPKPWTRALIEYSLSVVNPTVLGAKLEFDRVRPSVLDPQLKTAIEIPKHPAYPSGHATQAHTVALVLSDLDPPNRNKYYSDARRIALNREIAGVHYPSDSFAGECLAKLIFEELSSSKNYRELHLKALQEEWGATSEPKSKE